MTITEVRVFCPCCHQHTPTKLHLWASPAEGRSQIYAEVLDPTKTEGERLLIEIDIDTGPPISTI